MQYSSVAFSKDQSSYTIYPFHAEPKRLGQRLKFSDTDIKKVNIAYKCDGVDKKPTTKEADIEWNKVTVNGGDLLGAIEPAVCADDGSIDAAIMDETGDLYLFSSKL